MKKKKKKKNKKKKIVTISFVILFLFSLVGLFMIGIIGHENMHKWNYRNVTKLSEEVCYLNFNWSSDNWIGYYKMEYPNEQKEEVNKLKEYSEFKAYGVLGIILLIYIFVFSISIKYLIQKDENN